MAKARPPLIDRAIAGISPAWALERHRARQKLRAVTARSEYEGASFGRRTTGWRRNGRDANSELNAAVMLALRGVARDLVRNNPFAARGVSGIANYAVGAGITFQIYRNGKIDQRLTDLARAHFDTTACDAEGRHNLYGLQLQAMKTIVASGAILARRRWRRASDRLPVPFQVQLLEPDYLNMQFSAPTENGGYRLQGIQLDAIGRRSGYWMYSGHPGSLIPGSLDTKMIPATEIIHCYRADRPEQMHGSTWLAPVIVRLKDFGDYEDAQLVRQKIAACYAVFRVGAQDMAAETAIDSNGNDTDDPPWLTSVEPGMIEDLPEGAEIRFASPPGVDGYEPYSRISIQAISTGLEVPYELISGDLSNVSFISGRLGRLDFKRSVQAWQWTMLIPQLCEPMGQWFLEAAALAGEDVEGAAFRWTPPIFEMMDPATEVPATRDAVRAGQKSWSSSIRDQGEDPDVVLQEMIEDKRRFDEAGLVLDCDPSKVTQVGNAVQINSPMRADQGKAK